MPLVLKRQLNCHRQRRMCEDVSTCPMDLLEERLDALKGRFFWYCDIGFYDLAEEVASKYRALYRLYCRRERAQVISDVQQTSVSATDENGLEFSGREVSQ